MNNHQIKRRRLDGLAPAVIGILVAVVLLVVLGTLLSEAFGTITDTLHQAGTR